MATFWVLDKLVNGTSWVGADEKEGVSAEQVARAWARGYEEYLEDDCRLEAEIFVATCPSGRGAVGFRFWAERTTRISFTEDPCLEVPPPEDLEG
jgi:hypothetical protein